MTLLEELELFLAEYKAKYTSPDAILSLQKTFKSHNITVEDWNSLIQFIDSNLKTYAVEGLYAFLPKLVYAMENKAYVSDIVQNQTTLAFMVNPLKNISLKDLTAFKTASVFSDTTYPAVKILNSDDSILTKERAATYMKAITGSQFVPEFNFDTPTNTILIDSSGIIYKPQWDSTNGLLLYKVTNPMDSIIESLATKEYVDDNLQNVREVAEGKCKTFIIDYALTIEDLKSPESRTFDLDGNEITSAVQNGDYDNVSIANSDFNSQNDYIDLADPDSYLIISSTSINSLSLTENNYFLTSITNLLDKINLGDVFLVTQTNVPDRWVSTVAYGRYGGIALYKLETTKVDLNNYATKQYVDSHHDNTKLDKVTAASTASRVYAVNAAGNQTMFEMSSGGGASTVVLRSGAGIVRGATPVDSNDLTTKNYVDNITPSALAYTTTPPTADNTNGIKIVVLNSAPATKYEGYLYIITNNGGNN